MYAVIRSGGKQYTVRAGDTLKVEKLPRELGAEFTVEEVLLVGGDETHVGEPTLQGAQVTAVVTRQDRAPKIIVFKKKRRQGYRRTQGHRQLYTELFIKAIKSPSGEKAEAESKAVVVDPAKKAERQAKYKDVNKEKAKKTAAKKTATKKKVAKKAAKKKTAKKKAAKKTAKKKTAKKAKTAKK